MYLFLTNSTYQSFVFGRTYVKLCVVVLSCTDQPVLDMYLQCGCPILHCLYSTYLPLLLYYPTQTSLYLTLPAAAVVLPCTDQPVLDLTCCYCSIILHRPACTWTYLHLCKISVCTWNYLHLLYYTAQTIQYLTVHTAVVVRTILHRPSFFNVPAAVVVLSCTDQPARRQKKKPQIKEYYTSWYCTLFIILHKNVYLCM